MKLTGRTILITGGSAGIGLAFALKVLKLGNEVIVTGRRQSVLDQVKAKYPKLHTIQSDGEDSQSGRPERVRWPPPPQPTARQIWPQGTRSEKVGEGREAAHFCRKRS